MDACEHNVLETREAIEDMEFQLLSVRTQKENQLAVLGGEVAHLSALTLTLTLTRTLTLTLSLTLTLALTLTRTRTLTLARALALALALALPPN